MDNNSLIKNLKANYRDSSDLASPVVRSLISSLNQQNSYSPLLVEKLNKNGMEIISPSRQGKFFYEMASISPLATSVIAAGGLASTILYPAYAIPLIGICLGSFSYSYYHYKYFNAKIDNGYRVLQSSKEDMETFLKSLLSLKKQLNEIPEDLLPVDLKSKSTKRLVSDLVNILGHSIYLNIEKSNPINVSDVVSLMEKCQSLFSSGSHPELYFYETLEKAATLQKKKAEDDEPEAILDLGEKPDFSVKEDAISEGIKMAKALAEKSSEPKAPQAKRKRSSKKKQPEIVPPKEELQDQDNGENDTPESHDAPNNRSEITSTEDISNADVPKTENEESELTDASDTEETLDGQEDPGDPMRTNEPVTHVFDSEDEEFLEALNEKDDQDSLDLLDDDEDELPEAQNTEDFGDLDDAYDKIMEELKDSK